MYPSSEDTKFTSSAPKQINPYPMQEIKAETTVEELCRLLMERQLQIWQIDTEIQEIMYQKNMPEKRN